MSVKKTDSKQNGYRLIILCAGALILGSAIPLIVSYRHASGPRSILAAAEIIGAVSLLYVFAVYLLKK